MAWTGKIKKPAITRCFNPRVAVILHDLVMVALAWELAWLARFNFEIPSQAFWQTNLLSLPLVILVQGVISWRFTLYKGIWRFASMPDLWNILRAVALATALVLIILALSFRLDAIPRSVFVLYPLFAIVLLGGPRLIYRLWKDHSLNLGSINSGPRVLVVGAGTSGESLVRDMTRTGGYQPIGFLDDRMELHQRHIHGVPVLGKIEDVIELCEELEPDFLLIAIPSASDRDMQRIITLCEQTRVRIRTLPKAAELGTRSAIVGDIRDLDIEDLLGREKIELNWGSISAGLASSSVLVTGGGGSIGSELCRQIARLGPASIIIIEHSEYNLYCIEQELGQTFAHIPLIAVLGNITDEALVDSVMQQYQPRWVFHAAAYKHVPLLQHQVRQAVLNNIRGTQVVAESAQRHGVYAFVQISTDKAVNPTSVMGMCKRVAEMYCWCLGQKNKTRFITVRFGNVLGSAGSVVPLFRDQIIAGGPVTVTHPEITRYFMTIPEACQLILQAAVLGEGGEIFVLKMGEPVSIRFLAEQMIRLMGQVPYQDINIEYTGLRPGEKLYEELFHEQEQLMPTSQDKLMLARQRDYNRAELLRSIRAVVDGCDTMTNAALQQALCALVPENIQDADADSIRQRHDNVISLK